MTLTIDTPDFRRTRLSVRPDVRAAAFPFLLALVLSAAIWTQVEALDQDARIVLNVTVLAVIGWVGTRLPDSLVALMAALALVVTGAQPQEALTDTLGEQIVWLLLAAFVIAAVVKEAGLAGRLVAPLTRSAPRILPFFLLTGAAISLTAFLLPSTSGRAALLLPVFLGLLSALPDARLAKPLALLFPTAILLSAGGSLIGAGAHVVAVEAITATGGPQIGYLDWLMIGAPLAIASVLVASLLIFILFVPRSLWWVRVTPIDPAGGLSTIQRRILSVLVGLVALWIAEPLHGMDETIVALGGAVLLLFPPFCASKTKDVFRSVDVELVLYMAATLMLSVAMIDTGADQWLAARVLDLLPSDLSTNTVAIVVLLSLAAVASHLAITSRSARAAILIPALALPMAGLGHDATLAILIAVMGTGFCQTMMASAKPVAIFGMHEQASFTQRDLFQLALPLAPAKITLLIGFALWVWPQQLDTLRGTTVTTPAAPNLYQSVSSDQRAVIAAMLVTNSDAAPATSARPVARPAERSAVEQRQDERRAVQRMQRPVLEQVDADLRRAGSELRDMGKQLGRDLNRLFQ